MRGIHRGAARWLNPTLIVGEYHEFDAGADAKLAVDILQVLMGGVPREPKPFGKRSIGGRFRA
jgi:hypothetical protein